MATEVELKLLIEPADIGKLRRHPLLKTLAPGRSRTQHLVSIYFDTPDLTLRQQRIALRVRRVGSRWIQTVKGGGEVKAGLHSRGEWEDPVAHPHPDLTKIREPALARLFFSPAVRDGLQAVFITEFRRVVWLLQWDNGDAVELALDQGEVKSGSHSFPLCEVELELKQGNPARLYQAALELQQAIPLRLENTNKAERGYNLFQAAPPPLVKAGTPKISAGMSVAQAFQAIAWDCIGHCTANQEGVLSATDPEYVHQMRVALRRLRSALPLFAAAIPRESYATIADELKWIASELGPARNWDVCASQTLPAILEQFPGDKSLLQLQAAVLKAQTTARESARQAVLSPRYNRLLLSLGAWLLADGWHAQASAEHKLRLQDPVIELARRMLAKHHKTVRRHGPGLAAMPAEERHQVRITVKKLRYATEFLAALYPKKLASSYLEAMSALQDELGVLNDAATTRHLLAELGNVNAHAKGVVAGWTGRGVTQHLASLDATWQNFCDCRPFWK